MTADPKVAVLLEELPDGKMRVSCPSCGKHMSAPKSLRGRVVDCSKCNTPLLMPSAQQPVVVGNAKLNQPHQQSDSDQLRSQIASQRRLLFSSAAVAAFSTVLSLVALVVALLNGSAATDDSSELSSRMSELEQVLGTGGTAEAERLTSRLKLVEQTVSSMAPRVDSAVERSNGSPTSTELQELSDELQVVRTRLDQLNSTPNNTTPTPGELRVKRLVIEDENGEPRIVLGLDRLGVLDAYGVTVIGTHTKRSVFLGCTEDKSTKDPAEMHGLWFKDSESKVFANLSTSSYSLVKGSDFTRTASLNLGTSVLSGPLIGEVRRSIGISHLLGLQFTELQSGEDVGEYYSVDFDGFSASKSKGENYEAPYFSVGLSLLGRLPQVVYRTSGGSLTIAENEGGGPILALSGSNSEVTRAALTVTQEGAAQLFLANRKGDPACSVSVGLAESGERELAQFTLYDDAGRDRTKLGWNTLNKPGLWFKDGDGNTVDFYGGK